MLDWPFLDFDIFSEMNARSFWTSFEVREFIKIIISCPSDDDQIFVTQPWYPTLVH